MSANLLVNLLCLVAIFKGRKTEQSNVDISQVNDTGIYPLKAISSIIDSFRLKTRRKLRKTIYVVNDITDYADPVHKYKLHKNV